MRWLLGEIGLVVGTTESSVAQEPRARLASSKTITAQRFSSLKISPLRDRARLGSSFARGKWRPRVEITEVVENNGEIKLVSSVLRGNIIESGREDR